MTLFWDGYQVLIQDYSYNMYMYTVCNYAVLGKDTCNPLSQPHYITGTL